MSKSTVVVIGVSAIVLMAIGMHSISLNTEIDALKTQIGKQTAALDRLGTSLKRFETCAHMVNGSVGGKTPQSPTEVNRPVVRCQHRYWRRPKGVPMTRSPVQILPAT